MSSIWSSSAEPSRTWHSGQINEDRRQGDLNMFHIEKKIQDCMLRDNDRQPLILWYNWNKQTKYTTPRQTLQKGNFARVLILTSPTIGQSWVLHLQSRALIHHLQQGHDADARRHSLIRDVVFSPKCAYTMLNTLPPSSLVHLKMNPC
jgi:hypothetical protein